MWKGNVCDEACPYVSVPVGMPGDSMGWREEEGEEGGSGWREEEGEEERKEEEEEEVESGVLGDRAEVYAPSGEKEVLAWRGVRHAGCEVVAGS